MASRAPAAAFTTCGDCGRAISRRAEACPGCGAPEMPRPTQVQDRTGSFIIGILTIPVFGLGLIVLLAMLASKTRNGPCPYCGARGSWPDQKIAEHIACGNLVRREDRYIHPANDQADAWDGTLAKRRASD